METQERIYKKLEKLKSKREQRLFRRSQARRQQIRKTSKPNSKHISTSSNIQSKNEEVKKTKEDVKKHSDYQQASKKVSAQRKRRANVGRKSNKHLQKKKRVPSIYKPLSEWKDFLNGEEPVFLLGNGPSLSYQNLKLLENYFTVGINRISSADIITTIIFWQDISVSKDQKDIYLKSPSIKVCRRGCCTYMDETFLSFNMHSSRNLKQAYPDECLPDHLYGFGNTANIASQFVSSLNPSCIVMLGIDCKYEGDKTNFYGNNKRHSKRTMSKCVEALQAVKANCKIPIYNCGWNNFWEKRKLEDVIEEIGATKYNNEYFWDKLKK